MKVKISEILAIYARLKELNNIDVDLRDIEFLDDNDQVVQMDAKIVDDFRFTGLNNTDFIVTEFYKRGWDENK